MASLTIHSYVAIRSIFEKGRLMKPPTYNPHKTLTFSGLVAFEILLSDLTPKTIIMLIYVPIETKMSFVAKHNISIKKKKWIFGLLS